MVEDMGEADMAVMEVAALGTLIQELGRGVHAYGTKSPGLQKLTFT